MFRKKFFSDISLHFLLFRVYGSACKVMHLLHFSISFRFWAFICSNKEFLDETRTQIYPFENSTVSNSSESAFVLISELSPAFRLHFPLTRYSYNLFTTKMFHFHSCKFSIFGSLLSSFKMFSGPPALNATLYIKRNRVKVSFQWRGKGEFGSLFTVLLREVQHSLSRVVNETVMVDLNLCQGYLKMQQYEAVQRKLHGLTTM